MPGENLTRAFSVLALGLTLCDLCNHPGQTDFTTPVLYSNCQRQPHLAPLSWKLALAAAACCYPADVHIRLYGFPFALISISASSCFFFKLKKKFLFPDALQ